MKNLIAALTGLAAATLCFVTFLWADSAFSIINADQCWDAPGCPPGPGTAPAPGTLPATFTTWLDIGFNSAAGKCQYVVPVWYDSAAVTPVSVDQVPFSLEHSVDWIAIAVTPPVGICQESGYSCDRQLLITWENLLPSANSAFPADLAAPELSIDWVRNGSATDDVFIGRGTVTLDTRLPNGSFCGAPYGAPEDLGNILSSLTYVPEPETPLALLLGILALGLLSVDRNPWAFSLLGLLLALAAFEAEATEIEFLDANGDGVFTEADDVIFMFAWMEGALEGDVNDDGVVDDEDLATYAAAVQQR